MYIRFMCLSITIAYFVDTQLVFSIHLASVTIEMFFSKCKYIQSRTHTSMTDSMMEDILHDTVTQNPLPKDPEHLSADPASRVVCIPPSPLIIIFTHARTRACVPPTLLCVLCILCVRACVL